MDAPDDTTRTQEAELVSRLRQGDGDALQQLYLRYVDRLYSLIFHQVGRNKAVAEDIVQETFIAALNSASKFRGRSQFYTWLCSIAYHKITDFYRQQGRENRHAEPPSKIPAKELEQIAVSEPTILSKIESQEAQQTVEQALSRLPLDYRQALLFKYVEQMPVSEISLVMRRTPKSVEGLLTRARQTLRATLVKSGEG